MDPFRINEISAMKVFIISIIFIKHLFGQDSLFWFNMNSVLDPPPDMPKVMDGIFESSQLKVLDSLKYIRKLSNKGFRLQIFETVTKNVADTNRTNFQNMLQDTVYMVFEAPLYKLHFGNYLTKKDAKNHKDKLNALGFKNIWIVRSQLDEN